VNATPLRQPAKSLNQIKIWRQPIEPLLLGQPHAVAVFAHGMIRLGWRPRPGVLHVRIAGNFAAIERAAITA